MGYSSFLILKTSTTLFDHSSRLIKIKINSTLRPETVVQNHPRYTTHSMRSIRFVRSYICTLDKWRREYFLTEVGLSFVLCIQCTTIHQKLPNVYSKREDKVYLFVSIRIKSSGQLQRGDWNTTCFDMKSPHLENITQTIPYPRRTFWIAITTVNPYFISKLDINPSSRYKFEDKLCGNKERKISITIEKPVPEDIYRWCITESITQSEV